MFAMWDWINPYKWRTTDKRPSIGQLTQEDGHGKMPSPDIQSAFSEVVNHGSQLGQNFGTISNNFMLTSDKSESLPIPTHTLPFCRDSDFVNRGDLLNQIEAKCSCPASQTALVGLGGIGYAGGYH